MEIEKKLEMLYDRSMIKKKRHQWCSQWQGGTIRSLKLDIVCPSLGTIVPNAMDVPLKTIPMYIGTVGP